jgi:hypothetical protein
MRDPDAAAARAFIEAAGVELRFLCEEFGFDEPTVDHGPFAVWVTFKSTKTAVKATLDTLDKLVEVFVVKLVAGALPPYDETEATHYVDSLSLATAAARAETADDLRVAAFAEGEFRRVLGRSAAIVKDFADVLEGDFRRFDEAIAQRRIEIDRLEEEYQRETQTEAERRSAGLLGWLRRLRRSL